MKNSIFKIPVFKVLIATLTILGSALSAEEKIIQKEKLTYEKCINVISISEDKLSIAPKIFDEKDKKRIAVFKLSDGTLTITCDGIEEMVTVSTNRD